MPQNIAVLDTQANLLRLLDDAAAGGDSLAGEAACVITDLLTLLKPQETLVVSLNKFTAHRAGKIVRLSPSETTILHCLLKVHPKIISMRDLHRAVHGTKVVRSVNTLRVMINHLRKRVEKELSITVHNHFGKGYSLQIHPINGGEVK